MIRFATEQDIPAMIDMLTSLFKLESDFIPDTEAQQRGLMLMLEDSKPIWVAEENGDVVGMCTMQILVSTAQGTRVGHIEDVFVMPDHREQGVGKALLNQAMYWAIHNGLTRLQLFCDIQNSPALEFYKRTGWSQTSLIGIHKLI